MSVNTVDKTTGELVRIAGSPVNTEFVGTAEEWENLPLADKRKYDTCSIVDDNGGSGFHYSTTEQKTGDTWIDGKPIYKKVIEATMPHVETDGVMVSKTISFDVLGLTNMSSIVSCNALIFLQSGSMPIMSIPVAYNTNGTLYISRYTLQVGASSNLYLETNRNLVSDVPCRLILEYTKTTD